MLILCWPMLILSGPCSGPCLYCVGSCYGPCLYIVWPNVLVHIVNGTIQLSVSVSGPGLPALLPGETYSCHLADNGGRYNITVPARVVTEGVNYTCNITKAAFNYVGIMSGETSSTPCVYSWRLLCTLLYFIAYFWDNTTVGVIKKFPFRIVLRP